FRVVRTDSLIWWADDLGNSFANYPLTVFPFVARFLLTWIVPIAFLGFFPASALLGRADAVPFSPLLAYGAPIVGVGVFIAAIGDVLQHLAPSREVPFLRLRDQLFRVGTKQLGLRLGRVDRLVDEELRGEGGQQQPLMVGARAQPRSLLRSRHRALTPREGRG